MDTVTALATNAWSIIGNFVALILVAGLLFGFALKVGRAAFISLVISLYAGFALYSVFPYKDMLMQGSPMAKAIAALVIFGVLSLMPYLILRRVNTSGFMHIHPLPLALLAALSGAFVLALGYHFLGLAEVIPVSGPIATYITPDKYFFYWFVAPLVGFFLFAK